MRRLSNSNIHRFRHASCRLSISTLSNVRQCRTHSFPQSMSFRLKYFGDHIYEVDGFTTSIQANGEDIESLCTPNSSRMRNEWMWWGAQSFSLGGQPALNFLDASYIFSQIAKLFCLMFHHEQNERIIQKESNRTAGIVLSLRGSFSSSQDVIWKKYMPGWREVCDECLTTLFNYHYMCKQCGYMVCIECSNQFSQLTLEKRKSKFFEIRFPDQLISFRIKPYLYTRWFLQPVRIHSLG